MGLLDFNITEIASRMVRGASVRGRIRPTMDDGIVPTARVVDYTRAPYRLDEQKYFGAVQGASGAADGCTLCLLNKSTRPIVLESWRLDNRTVGTIRVVMTMVGRTIIDSLAIAGGDIALTSYENGPLPGTIRNDLILRNGVTVGGPFPVVATNFLDSVSVPSSANAGLATGMPALDLVIPPGTGVVWSATAINAIYTIAVQVRVVNNTTIT